MVKSDHFPLLERNFKLTKLKRDVCVTYAIKKGVNVKRERRKGKGHGKRKGEDRKEKVKEKIEEKTENATNKIKLSLNSIKIVIFHVQGVNWKTTS